MVEGHERYAQVKLSSPIQIHGLILLFLGLHGYHGYL
jgi:hypothetical protein